MRDLVAPHGVLRAGINMSNFLLVSSTSPDGGPAGVAPDMAAAIAHALDVNLRLTPFPNPGALAEAASTDVWDIALIGAEPQRAETIAFTSAYTEIEATYLVAGDSPITRPEDVDAIGRRIAVAERTAYCLWLERNIQRAELIRAQGVDASFELFRKGGLDALAGLRPRLIEDLKNVAGARLVAGRFMAVQQAIGVPREKQAAIEWLQEWLDAAVTQGFVSSLIAKHSVDGLSVAMR